MQFFDRSIDFLLSDHTLSRWVWQGMGWLLMRTMGTNKTSPTPRLIFIQVGFKSWHLFHYYDCLNVCSNLQWNTCILKSSRHQQYVQSLCCGGLQALGHGVLATILLARSFAGPGNDIIDHFDEHRVLRKVWTLSGKKVCDILFCVTYACIVAAISFARPWCSSPPIT